MSDMHLPSGFTDTYTELLVRLHSNVSPRAFNEIIEMFEAEPLSLVSINQCVWDALLEHARGRLSLTAVWLLQDARAKVAFDYSRYRSTVVAMRDLEVGEFLQAWIDAEQHYSDGGGLAEVERRFLQRESNMSNISVVLANVRSRLKTA